MQLPLESGGIREPSFKHSCAYRREPAHLRAFHYGPHVLRLLALHKRSIRRATVLTALLRRKMSLRLMCLAHVYRSFTRIPNGQPLQFLSRRNFFLNRYSVV